MQHQSAGRAPPYRPERACAATKMPLRFRLQFEADLVQAELTRCMYTAGPEVLTVGDLLDSIARDSTFDLASRAPEPLHMRCVPSPRSSIRMYLV